MSIKRTKVTVPALIVLSLAALACEDGPTTPPLHDPFGEVRPIGGGGASPDTVWLSPGESAADVSVALAWSEAEVVSFADPTAPVGASRIRRGSRDVVMRLAAGEMAPGEAATLWAVVFNSPDACVGECDDPDIFENPAARADMLYVHGAVANARGEISFTGAVVEGDASPSVMPLFGLPAWGILDAERSEIHLVVRSHGPVLPGLRRAQTTTFNGGCVGMGAEFGTPGENECTDLYYSSHYAR